MYLGNQFNVNHQPHRDLEVWFMLATPAVRIRNLWIHLFRSFYQTVLIIKWIWKASNWCMNTIIFQLKKKHVFGKQIQGKPSMPPWSRGIIHACHTGSKLGRYFSLYLFLVLSQHFGWGYRYRRARLSVCKQLPCEHTQGYNSAPIAIICGTQLLWVLIKLGIVN